jgi:THO complex subunit 2
MADSTNLPNRFLRDRGVSSISRFQARSLTKTDDRRDQQLQHQPSTAPSGPPGSNPAGIHPSRLENFGNNRSGPPTPANNMSNAPSGPRGSGRTPQGPPPMPMNRGPPTGPAMNDRGPRNSDNRHPLRTINSVLTQNAPTPDRLTDQSASAQSPITVRGRGANRANGPMDRQGDMAGPMPPPSHTSTPSMRNESQHSRSDRTGLPPNRPETEFQEERSESHSRRESRRGERSGHDRSHSSSRSDKRPDERSSRTHTGPPTERVGQLDEQERGGGDRERGREKRGSERESSRHHRERGSERSHRDTERSSHESRESKRERGSRDEGRTSGRDERDRRSRGGGNGGGGSSGGAAAAAAAAASAGGGGGGMSGDDGRKRVRDPTDQAHGDVKRRR